MCGEAKNSLPRFPLNSFPFFFVTQAPINADLKILANPNNSTTAFFVEIQTRVENQPCNHIPNLINSGKAAGKSWFLSIPANITGKPALNIKDMKSCGLLHLIPICNSLQRGAELKVTVPLSLAANRAIISHSTEHKAGWDSTKKGAFPWKILVF